MQSFGHKPAEGLTDALWKSRVAITGEIQEISPIRRRQIVAISVLENSNLAVGARDGREDRPPGGGSGEPASN